MPKTAGVVKWAITAAGVGLLCLDVLHAIPASHSYYSTPGGTSSTGCTVTACASCSAGNYRSGCGSDGSSPYSSQGTCLPCTNLPSYATYTVNNAAYSATDCTFVCNSGYQKDGTLTSCILSTCAAPSDSHAVVAGSAGSCTYTCNAGYTSSSTQTQSYTCGACSAGAYSLAGNTVCTTCPAGSFSGTTAQSACTACAAGTFAVAGSTVCTACPAGTYSGATSQSACTACATGTYSSTTSQSACPPCFQAPCPWARISGFPARERG